MGAFTGGDKLKAKLAEISAKASKAATLQVGFLEGATYPDGTSLPMVAAIQEFGAPKVGIPPRPYFRNMIAAKSSEWPEAVGNLLTQNDYDAEKTLGQAGEGIKGQLQQSIADTFAPPLSVLTLMARKWKADNPDKEFNATVLGHLAAELENGAPDLGGVSTKPLVESGHLLNSVDYTVKS